MHSCENKCCQTVDIDLMWSKRICPSLDNFVTQQTLTRCGRKIMHPLLEDLSHSRLQPIVAQKYAPHWRTLSCSRLWPNVAQKCASHWRTLSHNGLRPNVAQKNMTLGLYRAVDFGQMWPKNVPLIEGLCHAADFNQMWLENCASCRKIVSQCKPKS
jgi:hypothetical protein